MKKKWIAGMLAAALLWTSGMSGYTPILSGIVEAEAAENDEEDINIEEMEDQDADEEILEDPDLEVSSDSLENSGSDVENNIDSNSDSTTNIENISEDDENVALEEERDDEENDSEEISGLGSEVAADIEALVTAASDVAGMSSGELADLQEQIAEVSDAVSELTDREQEILYNSISALENAEAAVTDTKETVEIFEATGEVVVNAGGTMNSFRYLNGQPIADALQEISQESAAIEAHEEGEDAVIVDAIADGTVSVESVELSKYTVADNVENSAILLSNNNAQNTNMSIRLADQHFGVDVSEWQGAIDWTTAKESGVEYAILRCAYGSSYKDIRWETNTQTCEALGIPYGVYIYSTASTISDIEAEADFVLSLLEGHSVSLPVYIDVEENAMYLLGNEKLSYLCAAFCKKIEEAGYTAGVYSSTSWWNNVLLDYAENSNYSRWVAQWPVNEWDALTYEEYLNTDFYVTYNGSYQNWQFGVVADFGDDCFNGNVDGDFWYGPLTANEPGNLNTEWFSEVEATYRSGTKVTAGWRTDSYGKWYRNSDGSYPVSKWMKIDGEWYWFNAYGYCVTGWRQINGNRYYFDPDTCIMQTGWNLIDGQWYFLRSSGAMQTGWGKDHGNWYYFGDNGVMRTGWQMVDGTWYYMRSTGGMQTGWVMAGGIWYYMRPGNGGMRTGWVNHNGTWYFMNVSSGAMRTGWVSNNGHWYFMDYTSGAMRTGWVHAGLYWYYMDAAGIMVTEDTEIDGVRNGFLSNGIWTGVYEETDEATEQDTAEQTEN